MGRGTGTRVTSDAQASGGWQHSNATSILIFKECTKLLNLWGPTFWGSAATPHTACWCVGLRVWIRGMGVGVCANMEELYEELCEGLGWTSGQGFWLSLGAAGCGCRCEGCSCCICRASCTSTTHLLLHCCAALPVRTPFPPWCALETTPHPLRALKTTPHPLCALK